MISDSLAGRGIGEARSVERAMGDLRRGTAVLLVSESPLAVMAVETGGIDGLADLAAMSASAPVLVVSAERAAALLARPMPDEGQAPVAFRLSREAMQPDVLRSLADPVRAMEGVAAGLVVVPAPDGAVAALTLARLSRLLPAVLAATVDRGTSAGLAAARGLLSVAAASVEAHALGGASLARVAEAQVPLAEAADARVVGFRPEGGGTEQIAIIIGAPDPASEPAPLVRLHSECFTGDLLASLRCDCGEQLRGAVGRMREEGSGVVLYLAQEGRGIGLMNKLRAYSLQDEGLDTLDANRALGFGADERDFGIAATMLRALGLTRVRLLTNNPDKVAALTAAGITVTGRVGSVYAANGTNDAYLATKAGRFGHLMGE